MAARLARRGVLPRILLCTVAAALDLLAGLDAPLARAAGDGPGRVRLTGRIEGYGIVRFDQSSPRQLPLARLDLAAEQRVVPRWRWRLSVIGLAGGPPEDPSAGVFDLGHTFQNLSPSLEFDDAYVDYAGDEIGLRAGKQKFFWGRLDGIQPNDLLNPSQYEDPFLTDERDAKIAVPAISATWLFPRAWRERLPDESRFTLAWVPFAVPWRYPLDDERWFAPSARARDQLSVAALPNTPCPCDVTVEQQLANSPAPARQLDNGNLGVRFSGRFGSTDFALVYFDGYDPAPNFSVPIRLVGDPVPPPGEPFTTTAQTQLRPAYRRFRSIGADAATPLGPFTIRAEAAWRFRRPYPFAVEELTRQILDNPVLLGKLLSGETIDLASFAERDAVEWGIGADTVVDGFTPLLEIYQIILLHNDQNLLVRNVDTRVTARLSRRWMADRLEGELIGLWGIEAGYELLRAEASYDVADGLQVVAGVLGVWGDRNSIVGQYKRNGEAFAKIRYTF
jgi:Protein of unknown function (DUF1302)